MTQLEQYSNSVVSLALLQGAGANKPITFKTRSDSPNLLVVAYETPGSIALILPLDVFYICIDPASPTYNVLTRRTYADNGAGGYVYGTRVVTDYAELSTAQQVYAPDAPEHVVLSTRGGQLQASIYPVAKPSYTDDEATPFSWVRTLVNGVRASFLNMYQNMNNRVLYQEQRLRIAEGEIDEHTYQISQLWGSAKFYSHVQAEASDIWVIEHSFPPAEYTVSVFTFDEQGDPVWSDQIAGFGTSGAHVVSFLGPCSGHAVVVAQLKV